MNSNLTCSIKLSAIDQSRYFKPDPYNISSELDIQNVVMRDKRKGQIRIVNKKL